MDSNPEKESEKEKKNTNRLHVRQALILGEEGRALLNEPRLYLFHSECLLVE